MISTIADFYGWLWIIGSAIGAFYMYRASRPYIKKINKNVKKVNKIPRSTLISELRRN